MDLNDPNVFFFCREVGCKLMKIRCVERQKATKVWVRPKKFIPKFPFCQTCEQGKEIEREVNENS